MSRWDYLENEDAARRLRIEVDFRDDAASVAKDFFELSSAVKKALDGGDKKGLHRAVDALCREATRTHEMAQDDARRAKRALSRLESRVEEEDEEPEP